MKILRWLPTFCLILMAWPSSVFALDDIIVIKINGAINPVVAEFVTDEIDQANVSSAELIVIQMDTPGGLDTSMRQIIKGIESSNIPVASFVSPGGSRAASAGTFITIASHIAVMEPGTNIGAAHPVNLMGGGGESGQAKTMEEKVVNDAAAYIRSLAELRGRNAQWAELSVRNSVSISAEEAQRLAVIDLVAVNLNSLVLALDKREVKIKKGTVVLSTVGKNILFKEMNRRQRILDIISNPNITYILMMLGLVGLYLELSNPGLILPGVIGAISMILALYAMQTLPINYAGLMLIILGAVLFIAEINVMSYGLLSVSGAISIFLGSIMLIDSDDPAMQISRAVLYPTLGMTLLVTAGTIYLAARSSQLRTSTGLEGLVGEAGVVKETLNPQGRVLVHGEIWNAESDVTISEGEKVVVESVAGLTTKVRKASE
ncbi:MAG: nodulation protein NfeD [Nitrospinaceae bacterium]|jgi:membrane-bound serine protease (ClpP class)|nr:nodulation protein NfeD [Nitrospinaceae bacterium]MDP6657409.1 nodulation protein NfeD [Nitrospinaceae bacterium]MDP6711812.1 nodulation protein NfeD [Nitrospinaceae bacterium]MDP7057474.1 nodulation protein NfeD [Nitrospinaceae bacterium]HAK38467.1 serine protease [Nitrospina sp.]